MVGGEDIDELTYNIAQEDVYSIKSLTSVVTSTWTATFDGSPRQADKLVGAWVGFGDIVGVVVTAPSVSTVILPVLFCIYWGYRKE